MKILKGPKDSEEVRVMLGAEVIMGPRYSETRIGESEDFEVVEASGYPGQNRQYPLMQYRH